MLLQTNSYIVPKEKRAEHARVMKRFRQVLARLGCDHFEVYEQVGANWSTGRSTGRFVQIMRFRDREHYQQVQEAERTDPAAQDLIREFCELLNIEYQQDQKLFALGFYISAMPVAAGRAPSAATETAEPEQGEQLSDPPADPSDDLQAAGLTGLDGDAAPADAQSIEPEPRRSA